MSFRARLILTVLTIMATLCSCSSTSIREQQTNPKLVDLYRRALAAGTDKPEFSCALWQDVLKHPKFPLITVARLHSMEVCGDSQPGMPSIETMMVSTQEPWLTSFLVRTMLTRAARTGNKPWEMKLSARAADLENTQREKIKRLRRAEVLATEIKDAETTTLVKSKIETLAPRFLENPKPEDYLAVAADYKQAREFERAREYFQKVVAAESLPTLDKLKALEGIRQTYKLEKKTDNYIAASKATSAFAEKELLRKGLLLSKRFKTADDGRALLKKYFDTRLQTARAIWTQGGSTEAEQTLKKAEDDVRGHIPIHESLFIRAAIEEERGHFEKTVEILKTIDANQVAGSDLTSKILWLRAWNLRRLGRLPEAVTAFTEMLGKDDTSSRARFWLAKTEKDLKDDAHAKADFEKIIETDRMSWYALLSYRELGQPLPALPAPAFETSAVVIKPGSKPLSHAEQKAENSSAFTGEQRSTLEWLLATGENDLAKSFLNHISKNQKLAYSDDQMLELLQAYARAGSYQTLFSQIALLPQERRTELFDRHPELQFPEPWSATVQSASAKMGVEPELIYAIMRQESSFNPFARSGADAFGLMQLIPEMAQEAEQTAGQKIAAPDDLYDPNTNVTLGAAFLHDLLSRSQNRFVPAVASYNANEKAFATWMKMRYRGDILTFIEDVPYEETRTYIKLVMRNYVIYKRLNSRGAVMSFPEWCLANLQDAKS